MLQLNAVFLHLIIMLMHLFKLVRFNQVDIATCSLSHCIYSGLFTANKMRVFWIVFDKSILLCTSVLWRCWLGGRKGIRPVKNLDAGMVICLEQGADLHMVHLIDWLIDNSVCWPLGLHILNLIPNARYNHTLLISFLKIWLVLLEGLRL